MKRIIKIASPYHRRQAVDAVVNALDGYVVTISEPTRSLDQNARLWAHLQDISRAQPFGRQHTPDDWKAIAMNACGWDCQFIEGLDGRPFPMGFRSSKMTVRQMADLLSWIEAFMAENNIPSSEPNPYE